jgi:diguanylate cyclase (GGDEF)-like protein
MQTLDTNRATVLIIDNDPINVRMLTEVLNEHYTVHVAKNRIEALHIAFKTVPDLILIDIETPEISGYEVFAKLKGDPHTQEIPIIVVTAMRDGLYETVCLELGAIDFIKKPFNPKLVQLRVENHIELKRLRDYYKEMSCVDELTHLPNRRALNDYLTCEWQRLFGPTACLSVIMIDIDHFKQYNDHYGHLAGDECLVEIANTLHFAKSRNSDMLARFGGEEFIYVLSGTDKAGAITVGEKLCDLIASLQIPHNCSDVADHVTISLGAATATGSHKFNSPNELIEAADKNLYLAKSRGRNQFAG